MRGSENVMAEVKGIAGGPTRHYPEMRVLGLWDIWETKSFCVAHICGFGI